MRLAAQGGNFSSIAIHHRLRLCCLSGPPVAFEVEYLEVVKFLFFMTIISLRLPYFFHVRILPKAAVESTSAPSSEVSPPPTCTVLTQTFRPIFFWTRFAPPLPSFLLLLLRSSRVFPTWLLLLFLHLSPCRQRSLSELYPLSPPPNPPPSLLLFLRGFLLPPGGAAHCGSVCYHPKMFSIVSAVSVCRVKFSHMHNCSFTLI